MAYQDDLPVVLAAFGVGIFAGTLIGLSVATFSWQDCALKRGVGSYNPKTGTFELLDLSNKPEAK